MPCPASRSVALALAAFCTLLSTTGPLLAQDAPQAETALARPHGALLEDQPLKRIAFGSCAQESRPQPIWHAIADHNPDVFIFLGDNIYGDTEDMSVMRDKYEQLLRRPPFQRLCRSCPVLATWDDHDYGQNDVGAEYGMRAESQQLFCDFFSVPASSPRRQRPGIYDAVIVGPPGRQVQIVLLDTRYFRSPLIRGDRGSRPGDGRHGYYVANKDPNATLLGEAQWQWLETQLGHKADLRIIASSIQFASEEHGFEKWMNMSHERQRFCRLIEQTQAKGIIFLSGDRHHGEISRLDECSSYPIFDVTASALNQTKQFYNELNRHRLGSVFSQENFGLMEINWDRPDPTISLQLRQIDGSVVIRHDISLSMLR